MKEEREAARAFELPGPGTWRGRPDPDVAEQSCEERAVDRLVARGVQRRRQRSVDVPSGLGQCGTELRVHIAPFSEPQERHEARAAFLHSPVMRQALVSGAREELP